MLNVKVMSQSGLPCDFVDLCFALRVYLHCGTGFEICGINTQARGVCSVDSARALRLGLVSSVSYFEMCVYLKFDRPVTEFDCPVIEFDRPVTEFDCPVTECDCPVTEFDCPVTEFDRPVTECDCPVTECDCPVTECDCPVTV